MSGVFDEFNPAVSATEEPSVAPATAAPAEPDHFAEFNPAADSSDILATRIARSVATPKADAAKMERGQEAMVADMDPSERRVAQLGAGMHRIVPGLMSAGYKVYQHLPEGAQHLAQKYSAAFGMPSPEELGEANQASINETAKTDEPLLKDTAGQIISGVGQAVPTLGVGSAKLLPQLATNLAASQTEAVPEDGPSAQERAAGAVAGTIIPKAVIGGAGVIAHGVGNMAGPATKDAVQFLISHGVPLDAIQKMGSKVTDLVRRYLSDNPASQPTMAAMAEQTKAGFTKALLKTAGSDADRATPQVMDDMFRDIGARLDGIAARGKVQIDAPLQQDIRSFVNGMARTTTDENMKPIINSLRNIITSAARNNGIIPGEVLQVFRSDLAKMSKFQGTAANASDLQDLIMKHFDRQMAGTGNPEEWANLRRMWSNAKIIQNSVANDTSGLIEPARVTQQLRNNYNKTRFTRSDDEASELTKSYNTIMDKYPNSGTTHRAMLQYVVPGLLASGAAVTPYGEQDTAGRLTHAAATLAAYYGLPYAAGKVITSKLISQGAKSPWLKALAGIPETLDEGASGGLSRAYAQSHYVQPPTTDPTKNTGDYKTGGKVEKVLHEWKAGQLHSGSKKGPVVTSQKQALAIGFSEQKKQLAGKYADGGEVTPPLTFSQAYPKPDESLGRHPATIGGATFQIPNDAVYLQQIHDQLADNKASLPAQPHVTRQQYREITRQKIDPATYVKNKLAKQYPAVVKSPAAMGMLDPSE
jgi:hypothetical protein